MRFVSILSLVTLWLVANPFIARLHADGPHPPADVSLVRFSDADLPRAPDGFSTFRRGRVRWDHPPGGTVAQAVNELAVELPATWSRIERELGQDVDDTLVIRVARSPDEMASLAPSSAPPPAYAVGVAYPASGLILLTLSAPETWALPDLPRVLSHELSHIAFHRAVRERAVPRWLTEGLAIHQARERSFDRLGVLWEAVALGRLLPLSRLSSGFPSRPHEVGVAYAESADFVAWLSARGAAGESRFPDLVRRLGNGRPVEEALSQTWSVGPGQLEQDWRLALSERFTLFPLVVGTGMVWALVSMLVVMAWWRRRHTMRATLRRWGAEEAEQDARALAARHHRQELLERRVAGLATLDTRDVAEPTNRPSPHSTDSTDPQVPLDDVAPIQRASSREASTNGPIPETVTTHSNESVPTVRHEGRTHTLH